MAESEHNDTITIREIEYSIRLTNKESRAYDLCELLRLELTRFEDSTKKAVSENPIRDFLKTNIEHGIEFSDNTKVYLLNYTEEGSLSLIFTMLLIADSNYGDAIQAIDSFIKNTISGYFEEILERHLPVSISVYESGNNSVFNTERKAVKPGSIITSRRDYLAIILSTLAVLIAVGLSLVWIIQKKPNPEFKNDKIEYQFKYLDSIIENKIKQSLEDKNYDIQIQKRSESDSIQNAKSMKNK
jgi:hypothetical protein